MEKLDISLNALTGIRGFGRALLKKIAAMSTGLNALTGIRGFGRALLKKIAAMSTGLNALTGIRGFGLFGRHNPAKLHKRWS